jgi:hypothetical protein
LSPRRLIAPIILRLFFLNREFSSSDPTLNGVLASVWTQIQISYAIVAATIPCLRPFMNALSTNYGAPAQTKSPSGSKQQYKNNYSLSSLSKGSRLGRIEKLKASAPLPSWDRTNHQTSVMSGDQHSMESHESKKMIISKKNEWTIDYEGPSQQSAEP